MAFGDYEWYRKQFGAVDADLNIVAAADPSAVNVLACPVNHTLFVQRIDLNVTTDNAATLTFRDNAGTPIVIASTKASPGIGHVAVADFGPRGKALTQEKGLDLAASGAGLAGGLVITGYKKLTKVAGV